MSDEKPAASAPAADSTVAGAVICSWCSTEAPAGAERCASCGASLIPTEAPAVPGVTALDTDSLLRSQSQSRQADHTPPSVQSRRRGEAGRGPERGRARVPRPAIVRKSSSRSSDWNSTRNASGSSPPGPNSSPRPPKPPGSRAWRPRRSPRPSPSNHRPAQDPRSWQHRRPARTHAAPAGDQPAG